MIKITWLGQAGFLFETNQLKIMIDPYLSDSVRKSTPANYRRVEVKEELFQIKPDIMIFTHNHLDHYDPETVENFITEDSGILVLAPQSVWGEVRKRGGKNNYVLFNRHTVWTEKDMKFIAVKAEHSDPSAIGVIIEYHNKKYYVTGDTLYNEEIFSDLPDDIFAVFLPVNGLGNNMNMADAKRFCDRINPEYAVPMHCGMFDEISLSEFAYQKKVIPEIYKEVMLK